MALLGCNNTVPVLKCSDCPDEYANRIIHVAFIKRGVTIPTTSVISSLLAAELAGNAYILRNVNGEYDGATFSDRTGRGKQDTQNGSAVQNVVFTDFTPIKNRTFHNEFKNIASNFYMIYITESVAHYANSPMRMMPNGAITRDLNTLQEAQITVRWTNKDLPSVVSGINDELLEACPELFTFVEDDWYVQSGADGTFVGDELTIATGGDLDARYDAFTTISSVELDENSDALPTGVSLGYSGNAIRVYGTPTVAGTSELIIIGRNTTGVAGTVTLTLIVA